MLYTQFFTGFHHFADTFADVFPAPALAVGVVGFRTDTVNGKDQFIQAAPDHPLRQVAFRQQFNVGREFYPAIGFGSVTDHFRRLFVCEGFALVPELKQDRGRVQRIPDPFEILKGQGSGRPRQFAAPGGAVRTVKLAGGSRFNKYHRRISEHDGTFYKTAQGKACCSQTHINNLSRRRNSRRPEDFHWDSRFLVRLKIGYMVAIEQLKSADASIISLLKSLLFTFRQVLNKVVTR